MDEQLIANLVVSDTAVTLKLDLAPLGAGGAATLVIPASIGRAGARLSLVVPGSVHHASDTALVAVVAQARDCFAAVASGLAATLAGIAAANGVTQAYVRQIIGAAFLAPDLVTAIVEGGQPRALGVARLRPCCRCRPAGWSSGIVRQPRPKKA